MFPLLILGCMCCFFDFYILHHEDENRGATVRRSGSDKFMSEPYVSLLKYLIIFVFGEKYEMTTSEFIFKIYAPFGVFLLSLP